MAAATEGEHGLSERVIPSPDAEPETALRRRTVDQPRKLPVRTGAIGSLAESGLSEGAGFNSAPEQRGAAGSNRVSALVESDPTPPTTGESDG